LALRAGNGSRQCIGRNPSTETIFLGGRRFPYYCCFLPAIRELTDGLRAIQASKTENIKIARKDIFSYSFFAPFNSFFFEAQNSLNLKQNQGVRKNLCLKSILKLSADPWSILYRLIKPFLFTVFQNELN